MTRLHRILPAASLLFAGLFVTPLRADERPLRQLIDEEVRAAWQQDKLTPAAVADDAAFLRRIYLNLVGTIPTYDEAQHFLHDADPQKRAKLIDQLLADPRFATHQMNVWDLALFGRNPPNGDAVRQRDAFKKWLTEQFAKNTPYDQLVRALLLAEQDGPALFYVQYRNQPEETAVAVSRLFLGTQLQCARCHDHPYEKWTQRDFYGVAAFFARLVFVEAGAEGTRRRYVIGEKSTGDVLFTGPAIKQKPGQKGEPVKPKFLAGAELVEPPLPADFKEPAVKGNQAPPKPLFSRKDKLAAWVTAPENPYFAKAAANRLWAQFMGRGVVHPVDNLSNRNPPSHPRLFEALTEQLTAHQFDTKWFIRELVNSQTYQLAATGSVVGAMPEWFERARVRPLSAEEILAALRVATGFDAGQKPGEDKVPSDTRAYIERYFGEPTDGRGDFQAGLNEHLFLNNSSQLRQFIQPRKGNLADTLIASKATWDEKVERLFLSILSRPPSEAERTKFVAYLTADPKPEQRVEEAIWVLLNTSEFRFNH